MRMGPYMNNDQNQENFDQSGLDDFLYDIDDDKQENWQPYEQPIDSAIASHQPSTDYDDGWAEDLPSLTDMMEQGPGSMRQREQTSQPQCNIGEHKFETDLGSSASPLDEQRLQGKPPGRADSLHPGKNSDFIQPLLPQLETESFSPAKLFLTTDPPSELTMNSPKITAASALRKPVATTALKEGGDGDGALLGSPTRQEARSKPVLRPGMPAWVYDIDDDLVAGLQDIVDFV